MAKPPESFWPKRVERGVAPDLGDDRPCPICGYNLRGLPSGEACPECGSYEGRTEVSPLAWERRQTLGGFLKTLGAVFFNPAEFGLHAWRVEGMNLLLAERFRRANVAIGAACLSAIAIACTAAAALPLTARSTAGFALCAIVQSGSIVLGVNGLTHFRLRRLKDYGVPQAETRHMRALTCYLSAPLALSVLHLPLLPVSAWAMASHEHRLDAAAVHAALLFGQFLLGAGADAALLRQVLDMTRVGAGITASLSTVGQVLGQAIYLVLLPLVAAGALKYAAGG